jgi:hypothetical protein
MGRGARVSSRLQETNPCLGLELGRLGPHCRHIYSIELDLTRVTKAESARHVAMGLLHGLWSTVYVSLARVMTIAPQGDRGPGEQEK